MTKQVPFDSIKVLDYGTGSAGPYGETFWVLEIDGERWRYCSFGDDHFSGSQFEDADGHEIPGPDIEVTGLPDWADPDDWMYAVQEEFDTIQSDLYKRYVVPAEQRYRDELFPWSYGQ